MHTLQNAVYRTIKRLVLALRPARALFFSLTHHSAKFLCPICGYEGPFKRKNADMGVREHAQCPRCGSLERHRLQFMVMQKLADRFDFSTRRILHVAPEPFIQKRLRHMFGSYASTDLCQKGVDFHSDLRSLPMETGSWDVVYASHVLEHIDRDRDAIGEIRRVLCPGGFAILPVPIVGTTTVEYADPNPHEMMHVRAPGPDYFNKYREYFRTVEIFTSEDFPPQYQLFVYEDRSKWPTPLVPLRQRSLGARHVDYVPVCFV